jgi:hypothetical protein
MKEASMTAEIDLGVDLPVAHAASRIEFRSQKLKEKENELL